MSVDGRSVSAPDANGWMDIATAPRDGSKFLASTVLTSDQYDENERLIYRGKKERFAVVAYFLWGDFVEYPFRNSFVQNLEFTHWQPLPQHPVKS